VPTNGDGIPIRGALQVDTYNELVNYQNLQQLTLNGGLTTNQIDGKNVNTFNVESTLAGMSTILKGQGTSNIFNITAQASALQGPVSLSGTGTSNTLNRVVNVQEFPIPTPNSGPGAITTGTDVSGSGKAVWFAEKQVGQLGQVTGAGTVSEYSEAPPVGQSPAIDSLVSGQDGNLWFIDRNTNSIVATAPPSILQYLVYSALAGGGIGDLVAAPSGIWFTETDSTGSYIGHITFVQGFQQDTVTLFPIRAGAYGNFLTLGPDGNNLWFLEYSGQVANYLAEISPAGAITPNSITGLSLAPITYSGIANLTVDGGFGGNTIGVTNTAAATNTTLNSGNGPDVIYVWGTTGPLTVNTQQGNLPGGGVGFDGVEVGSFVPNVGYTLDSIQGALTVNTSQGGGNLALLDSAATASEQYTVTKDTITRSGMAPIHYLVTNELSFLLGSGGDNVNVVSTYPGLTTVFEGGIGDDTFTVGDSAKTLNGIQGHLYFQIANPGSRVILNDQGNPATVNYTFASTLTGVGLVPSIARSDSGYLFFYSGPLQQLVLNTSKGADTDVQSTPSPTTVTINGSGTENVNIGNSTDGVGDIQGPVNITNNPAVGHYTALTVDDSAYNRGYWLSTLRASSLTTTGRTDGGNQVQVAPISFNPNSLSSLKILLGNSPDTSGNVVSVADTPASSSPGGMMTTITSGIGVQANDAIYIGKTTGALTVDLSNDGLHPASSAFLGTGIRTLNNLRGPITVNSLSGWTDVVLDDSANTSGETYTITSSTVTFRPNLPVLTYHVTNELQLDAGSGVNTINVTSKSAAATAISAGASSRDSIVIGGSGNGLAGIIGGYLAIAIANPGNRLVLDDQGNPYTQPQTYTLGTAQPGLAGLLPSAPGAAAIFYSGPLVRLALNASNGNDTFAVKNLPLGQTILTIHGGSGSNGLIGPNQQNTWGITGANAGTLDGVVNFTSVQSLTGGGTADVFAMGKSGSLSGRLNGGGGVATLDYSSFKGDILVDLLLNAASQVSGGAYNIENVVGSIGNDILVGDANNNS
jgi:hypothetical protein